MARQEIILGTPPTGLGGDTPRVASSKINAMTLELYQGIGTPAAPLPLERGGTGGKTQVAAQVGLGLVPVSSATDTAAGRLVTPGWMGIGTASGLILPSGNANQELPSGLYYTTGEWTGSPFTGNSPLNRGFLIVLPWGQTGYQAQQFTPLFSAAGNPMMFRNNVSGTWRGWDPIISAISAINDPALNTGGLLSVSVVNGYSVYKFANGDGHIIGPAPTTAIIAAGTLGTVNVTLPSLFISTNFAIASVALGATASNDHYGAGTCYMSSSTNLLMIIRNGATAQTFDVKVSVWGRWK